MKVYISQYFYWEQEHIIGVFSTKEKAENAIQAFIAHNETYLLKGCNDKVNNCCSILEYDLDIPNIELDYLKIND